TRLWVMPPATAPLRAEGVPMTLVSGQLTRMRPFKLAKSEGAAEPARTFDGKVLAADGTPIAGALVRLLAEKADFDPGAYATTAADGTFAIQVRRGTPQHAQVLVGRAKLEIEHSAGVEQLRKAGNSWQLDLTGTRTLQCEDLVTAPV